MKPVKVTIRAGAKERANVRLKKGDTAIVFTTANGQKIEVDLMETHKGNVLLRSHNGSVTFSANDGTLEVTTQ